MENYIKHNNALRSRLAFEVIKLTFFSLSYILMIVTNEADSLSTYTTTLVVFIAGAWADNLSLYASPKAILYDRSFEQRKAYSLIGSILGGILMVSSLVLMIKSMSEIDVKELKVLEVVYSLSGTFIILKTLNIIAMINHLIRINYKIKINLK